MNARMLILSRWLVAVLFIASGIAKWIDPSNALDSIATLGLSRRFALVVFATTVLLELVAGIFLAAGVRVAPAAWALAGFTVLAGMLFHGEVGDPVQRIQLLKNLAIAGGLVAIALSHTGSAGNRGCVHAS